MKSLTNYTNGYMILSDSFNTKIFEQSFLKVFDRDDGDDIAMGFNATFDVQVSSI
jgi:protein transport protein SEC23